MSDLEALMWRLEKDPHLWSTFGSVTLLDRAPDLERLRARLARAPRALPRLRQRVRPAVANLGAPYWVDDGDFDVVHHVRRVGAPPPGGPEELSQLVVDLMSTPFDRTRPLWEFVVVEGLDGGQAALVEKLHHTVTDGEGGLRLSLEFLDLERNPAPPLEELDVEAVRAD